MGNETFLLTRIWKQKILPVVIVQPFRFPTLPFSLDLTRGYSPHFSTVFPSPNPLPFACLLGASPPLLPTEAQPCVPSPAAQRGPALPFCIWQARESTDRQHCQVSALCTREVGQGWVRCLEFLGAGKTVINFPPPCVALDSGISSLYLPSLHF